ncbi:MAG: hypothetical protein WC042_01915 [Candidatus Paceibacterota bacterium]|jgi:hypothetical protein|nr:hypothetical protein [Candidatus Paceibacterota bacterium]MDD3548746.1 hypothetical protein [Candidatus Paceibacterota bacterium]MDD4998909.1 hypothetical protein [Candidatus Paceibacterota bacterium]MDD5545450.1 hypothetical protein [Candidatus Paceibacterota bacterium]
MKGGFKCWVAKMAVTIQAVVIIVGWWKYLGNRWEKILASQSFTFSFNQLANFLFPFFLTTIIIILFIIWLWSKEKKDI